MTATVVEKERFFTVFAVLFYNFKRLRNNAPDFYRRSCKRNDLDELFFVIRAHLR